MAAVEVTVIESNNDLKLFFAVGRTAVRNDNLPSEVLAEVSSLHPC
jgi:hypothetical protein